MSISERVRSCVQCPLSAKLDSGFKPVPGIGSPSAKILFVYDVLTRDDYLIQSCLTSKEGLFFDKLLTDSQLSRKEMYITPLVKCYTPCMKDITADVVKTCGGWLDEQIEALKPLVIVAAGINSIARVLKRKKSGIRMGEITKTLIERDTTTLILPFPALFSLFNMGKSTFNYHADRLSKGREWVSQLAINMEKAQKN